MTLQWATRMGGVNITNNGENTIITPNHQRVEDEQPIHGGEQPIGRNERWNPVTLEPEEEARINAEMDAEEAQLEAYVRDAEENPEPNNLEEE